MKKDKYLKARGGVAQMIKVKCAACGEDVIKYQKDGRGFLKRCYLNRVFEPELLSKLQSDPKIKEPSDMPNLSCRCGNTLGFPMRHKDGRLAFRLDKGKFLRKKIK